MAPLTGRRLRADLSPLVATLLVAACATAPGPAPMGSSGPRVAAAASPSAGPCQSGSACAMPARTAAPATGAPGPLPSPLPLPPSAAAITLTPGAVRTLPTGTFALADGRAYTRSAPAEPYPPVTLAEVVLATGTRHTLLTRPAARVLSSLVLDGDRLLWVEWWYAHPQAANGETGGNPNAGQPLLWQVVSDSLASGTLTVLASGQTSNLPLLGEAASPQPPVLAAEGGRVAFAMDTGTRGVASSEIVVRSLATNALLRSIRASGYVVQVGLAGQALFYRQTTDGFAGDASLLLARSDTEPPVQIATKVSQAAMDSERLVWSRSDATDASIWTATLTASALGGPVPVRVDGPSGPVGQPGPVAALATGQGLVGWIVWFDTLDPAADSALVLWTPGEAAGRVLAGQRQPDWVAVQDGMLLWHESLPLPGHPDTHAVPLAAISSAP